MNKINYGHIFKEFVESVGYELLSDYKGARTKVKLRCNYGHEYKVIPNSFKQGIRCPICPRKYSIQSGKYFKDLVESVGYELLSDYKGSHTKVKLKCPKGHEYEVTPNNFKIGQKVTVFPTINCGKCFYCKIGRYNLCNKRIFLSTPPINGTLCDYIAIRADLAHLLPKGMDLKYAALAEPAAIAVHAVNRANFYNNATGVILGAGPIG